MASSTVSEHVTMLDDIVPTIYLKPVRDDILISVSQDQIANDWTRTI
jgi:hypothetical protein